MTQQIWKHLRQTISFWTGRVSRFHFLPDAQKFSNHKKMFHVAEAHMDYSWSGRLKKYLPVHKIHQKWYKERPQLKEHNLVWIVNNREKRGSYRLGKVKKCQFGKDGTIRSCDILTQSGVISPPSVNLFHVFEDIGCVSLHEKHRAGEEKAWKLMHKKTTSSLATLESHNSEPNERINPK